MDRLCEQVFTGITLDLRELDVHRLGRGGRDRVPLRAVSTSGIRLPLVPGPQPIHDVFVRAGVADVLPFRENETDVADAQHSQAARVVQRVMIRAQRAGNDRGRAGRWAPS